MKTFDLIIDVLLIAASLIFGLFGMVQLAVENYAHAAALFGLAWFNGYLVSAGSLVRARFEEYKKAQENEPE